MIHLAALVVVLFGLVEAPPLCIGLTPPVTAPTIASFAPSGRYSGHWGIDYAVDDATPVAAAGFGWVSHSGVVAGNRTVTIDHGGGLKTSYSYLDTNQVGRGAVVERGTVVGTVGMLHGGEDPGLHFSVRLDGLYVDPDRYLGCPAYELPAALRLVPVN